MAAMSRATLLLVDRAATREGARMALADEFRISGEADDVEQAIRLAKMMQPDVCLIGREVVGHDLASVREICHVAPACAVVLLSELCDVEDMLAAVRAGAVGYVPGALNGDRLRRVVAAAANEEAIVPRTMVHELLLELRAGGAGADALTARESQVLGMLRRGQSTAAIAERLQITPVTVRRHISELVRKLGVTDRSELVRKSVSAGAVWSSNQLSREPEAEPHGNSSNGATRCQQGPLRRARPSPQAHQA